MSRKLGTVQSADYAGLLVEARERIRSAQYDALRAVNKELIGLYWDIGRMIERRQQGESWGKSVVASLARDLQREFPGIQGFSAQNLWRMRQFHLAYAGHEKLSPLAREITWTKNVIILMQCKDPLSPHVVVCPFLALPGSACHPSLLKGVNFAP